MVEIWVQRQRAATFEFVKNVPVIVFVLDWALIFLCPTLLCRRGALVYLEGFVGKKWFWITRYLNKK